MGVEPILAAPLPVLAPALAPPPDFADEAPALEPPFAAAELPPLDEDPVFLELLAALEPLFLDASPLFALSLPAFAAPPAFAAVAGLLFAAAAAGGGLAPPFAAPKTAPTAAPAPPPFYLNDWLLLLSIIKKLADVLFYRAVHDVHVAVVFQDDSDISDIFVV